MTDVTAKKVLLTDASGNYIVPVIDPDDAANQDLSNLTSKGQAKFDAKLDKSTLTDCYVVVKKSDPSTMPSWYRIWSDGWCEQGGELGFTSTGWVKGTKSLNIPFKDTKYNVMVMGNWSDAASSSCTVTAKTTDSFTIKYAINTTAQKGVWRAEGYIS